MWATLYLALFALACGCTYIFAVRKDTVVLTAGIASISWALIAIVPEVTIATGGETAAVALGGERYLFAGLALISIMALFADLLGWYRDETDLIHPDHTNT